jgi:hypothetical protein
MIVEFFESNKSKITMKFLVFNYAAVVMAWYNNQYLMQLV